MGTRYSFEMVLLLVSFLPISLAGLNNVLPPKFFHVKNYGAISDGQTDNSEAFLRAWTDACAYGGRSKVGIPAGAYMLRSVSFEGPCNGSMVFLNKGTLKAPTHPSEFFKDTWIGFRYLNNLTVKGSGYFDGQGESAWQYNDCNNNPQCNPLPATMRFDFVTNSKVHRIRSINPKNSHINLFACNNLNISHVRLTSQEDSPNTDGIRIGSSSEIKISHSTIATGDDCVSMVSGTQNVHISDVSCGPGHGISIGSLGRSHEGEYVTGITVRNSTFIGTQNGVRIKTWAPSLFSLAANIVFKDLIMKNVRNPIVIDQQYCPFAHCLEGNSGVQIENVTFKNVWGSSSTKVSVNLQCSGIRPCKNVKLININLVYNGTEGPATALCSHVLGSSYGIQNPDGCL